MPLYDYKCKNCGDEKEIFHSMAEIAEPTPKTVELRTCFCQGEGSMTYEKMLSTPMFGNMGHGGSSMPGAQKLNAIKQERKKRNSEHFKKEVMPTIPMDDRIHFRKKYNDKNLGRDVK